MVLKTRFSIGDTIYFWSTKYIKVLEGYISGISVFANENTDDGVDITLTYYVKPLNIKGIVMSESVPEHLVFKSREDVFEFCMALTKDI